MVGREKRSHRVYQLLKVRRRQRRGRWAEQLAVLQALYNKSSLSWKLPCDGGARGGSALGSAGAGVPGHESFLIGGKGAFGVPGMSGAPGRRRKREKPGILWQRGQ